MGLSILWISEKQSNISRVLFSFTATYYLAPVHVQTTGTSVKVLGVEAAILSAASVALAAGSHVEEAADSARNVAA